MESNQVEVNKKDDVMDKDLKNNLDYVKLVKRLACRCIWGTNPMSVNISNDIIKNIKKELKEECVSEYEKKMIISTLDGYIDSINNLIIYTVLTLTIIGSFAVELINKWIEYEKVSFNAYPGVSSIIILMAAWLYTHHQQKRTKYNIIRTVAKELLKDQELNEI